VTAAGIGSGKTGVQSSAYFSALTQERQTGEVVASDRKRDFYPLQTPHVMIE